ncbi:hypothetical protein TREPR_1536 [Treponema primitia ZAS-2]|uniref:Uncharacterized protein n=1 Tax=Treponema primitia (strain ATCC BAA-887 / DSM 12427 / ZAS-2) TaxID=545694 RepID=F5YPG3_TREPZ|nr:hypothetical protein TREPR_1536 [Treponema primitia ZAS-2]
MEKNFNEPVFPPKMDSTAPVMRGPFFIVSAPDLPTSLPCLRG